MNRYEVILNGPALGIDNGDNIRFVDAERFETENSTVRTTFYVGDDAVAQFSHVLGVSVVSE